MSQDSFSGEISKNIFSLQLQIQTLLEDAGGDAALGVLDELSALNPSEQKIVLNIFSKIVSQIQEGEVRLSTAKDEELKKFEDELFKSIVDSIGHEKQTFKGKNGLAVLPGGRKGSVGSGTRKSRSNHLRPVA